MEKLIIILFSCKKWTYVEFSDDYVYFVGNIINSITIALWEMCLRTFSFLQIREVEGLLSYHGN